ncbi:glycosyltransferase family 1 protein [Arcobacter sp. F2176]|uniref:glycosyltransferase family 4 protein n=1 Tax=Arcobacter sp. F2176 TaxID=2044511 RepID=UPI00100B5F39|nr:glycosyltransferase family 1 protein [Arcobacter sp. F2176]RXJ79188.1 glycosyltransferase [Arcobacter sp. F2176]
MKIYYDNIIYSLQRAGGISVYWSELTKRLSLLNDTYFYGHKNDNIFMKDLNIDVKKESFINYKICRYLDFRKKLPAKSIFHSSYYRIANQKDIINVITVHDFTYEYFRSGLAKYIHSWQKSRAIKKSDGIICISENTKKDLLKFYPNILEKKIEVIYNGVSDIFKPLDKSLNHLNKTFKELREKKYILYVGDRIGYKNFDLVVNISNKLDVYSLVIIGGGSLKEKEREKINIEYFHYENISTKDLNVLYNSAFCLLYPSSYEGFGIPIIEAMKAGCPVVSMSKSSIPEVAGDAALLVENINEEDFIKEILKLQDDDLYNSCIRKGLEQAKKFSWDKCFDDTYAFYKKLKSEKF